MWVLTPLDGYASLVLAALANDSAFVPLKFAWRAHPDARDAVLQLWWGVGASAVMVLTALLNCALDDKCFDWSAAGGIEAGACIFVATASVYVAVRELGVGLEPPIVAGLFVLFSLIWEVRCSRSRGAYGAPSLTTTAITWRSAQGLPFLLPSPASASDCARFIARECHVYAPRKFALSIALLLLGAGGVALSKRLSTPSLSAADPAEDKRPSSSSAERAAAPAVVAVGSADLLSPAREALLSPAVAAEEEAARGGAAEEEAGGADGGGGEQPTSAGAAAARPRAAKQGGSLAVGTLASGVPRAVSRDAQPRARRRGAMRSTFE